jgi:hypothetical protein
MFSELPVYSQGAIIGGRADSMEMLDTIATASIVDRS